jgi:hypothetical protein
MDEWDAFASTGGTVADKLAVPASAPVDGHLNRPERARTLSLIDFLADYDARRNPPVYDIGKYGLYQLRDDAVLTVPGVTLAPAGVAWLSVEFIDLPSGPEVPAELTELLGDSESVSPHQRPVLRRPPDHLYLASAPPDPELVRAAEQWIVTEWEPFAARWAEANAAKKLHRELFQQRELLTTDRDSVELVWGFGRLRWSRDGTVVDHPLITIPIEIEQDEQTQRLQVCPAGAPEVEARCLSGLTLADRPAFQSVRQSVNDDGADLWDVDVLRSLLRPLVRAIDHQGTLVDTAGQATETARVDGSWVLFMRRRLPDYQGFLERMRALYRDETVAVPDTLQAVVSSAPSSLAELSGVADGTGSAGGTAAHDEPLLLPLPTNEEQQRILSQAQHSTGVTVQGPPGTGKSHTIANIISHYVAYGKRVLVVAEKEQALRTLTEKIPDGIKDLTVAVLGADADSRRELESAISQIQTRVTAIDKSFADDRIRQLVADLDAVDRSIATTTQALLRTREAEVDRLPGQWQAGDSPTRAQAARWVAAHAAELDYIDDPVTPATPSPVTEGELAELAAVIRRVGVDRAAACARELPALQAIPVGAELAERFAKLARLRASVRSLDSSVHDGTSRSRKVARGCARSASAAMTSWNGWPRQPAPGWTMSATRRATRCSGMTGPPSERISTRTARRRCGCAER